MKVYKRDKRKWRKKEPGPSLEKKKHRLNSEIEKFTKTYKEVKYKNQIKN